MSFQKMGGQPDKYVGHAGHVNNVSFSVYEYLVLVVLMYYLMGIEYLSLSHTHKYIYIYIYIYVHMCGTVTQLSLILSH
jgi:hypothetical protein